jgi:hypothetical protein
MNLALHGPWHSIDLLLKALSLARNRYTPPTDYRRELEAFPVDAQGLRCDAEEARAVRLCGRAGTELLLPESSLAEVSAAVSRVLPVGVPVEAHVRGEWAVDVLDYLRTVLTAAALPPTPASA